MNFSHENNPSRASRACGKGVCFYTAMLFAVAVIVAPTLSPAQDTVLSTTTNGFNVQTYGAIGNGYTDDTTSIQSAINAAVTKGSGVVIFPTGTYLISAPLTMTNAKGIALQGSGRTDTSITPAGSMAGKSMIYLVNCGYCAIRNMKIRGNQGGPSYAPLCAIESHVNHPTTVIPTHLTLERLFLGEPGTYLQYGARWTCEPNNNVNNDQAQVFDCSGSNYTLNAEYYIGHSSSTMHRFQRTQFGSATGVETHGGSVIITNSWCGTTKWFLDFEDGQYTHPSMVSDTDSETSSGIVNSTAGAAGCNLVVSRFGSPSGVGNGTPWISWKAPGLLSFDNSLLDPSAPASPVIAGAGSTLRFTNSRIGIHNLEWAGYLSFQSNISLYNDLHRGLIRDAGAKLFESGNSGPSFDLAQQGWTSLNTTYAFADVVSDAPLNGVHGGIDFGTGAWTGWGPPNLVYFSTGNVTSATFTLPAGTFLKGLKISDSQTPTGTYSISDGVNPVISGNSSAAVTEIPTGWSTGGRVITLTFSTGWYGCLYEITYGG